MRIPSSVTEKWKYFSNQLQLIEVFLNLTQIFRQTNFLIQVFFNLLKISSNQLCNYTQWVEKCFKMPSRFFWKITIFSVKSTFLLKKLLKSWFHEFFEAWSCFMVLFHCACTFLQSSWKNSSNQPIKYAYLYNYSLCLPNWRKMSNILHFYVKR